MSVVLYTSSLVDLLLMTVPLQTLTEEVMGLDESMSNNDQHYVLQFLMLIAKNYLLNEEYISYNF